REDGLFDGGQALARTGNLDEEIGPRRAGVEALSRGERARGVVGEERRHLERDPAVHAVGAIPDGTEEIGGPRQVLDGQLEEERLPRLALAYLLPDGRVVGRAVLDGVIEDGGIRGETGHGELVDVALERAVLQDVAGDIVEPEALAQVVQQLCRFHGVTSLGSWITNSRGWYRPIAGSPPWTAGARSQGRSGSPSGDRGSARRRAPDRASAPRARAGCGRSRRPARLRRWSAPSPPAGRPAPRPARETRRRGSRLGRGPSRGARRGCLCWCGPRSGRSSTRGDRDRSPRRL